MKIHLVSLEDGITAIGFRRIAAFVEQINKDTQVFYVGTRSYQSLSKWIRRSMGQARRFASDEIDEIAQSLAGADLVAFSSMTGYAGLTKALATRIREINPRAYLMWGGIHPIIYPQDAIEADVDAICTGEGEFPISEFLQHFDAGTDYRGLRNFWFKERCSAEIKRNPFRALMTPSELAELPFPKYGGREWIYYSGRGFAPVKYAEYLTNNGLGYPTIWSIGCPLHCTYCGNTVFIANDPNYRKVRHSGVDHIVAEVQRVRQIHPHIQTILFCDDSFMVIPLRELTEFSKQWREQIGIPFCVFGIIPTSVETAKVEILTWAGMIRVRMGIESGSERILKFYKRPTPVAQIERAANILAQFAHYQVNPSYDIIVDNPIETRQDVIDTLELVYRLARPFTLNIFSLRIIPNTLLEKQMIERGFDVEPINEDYHAVKPLFANVLLQLLMVWRPPRWLFDRWLTRVRAYEEEQKSYRILTRLVRAPWLIQQGLRHLRQGEFTVITGCAGYILWKIGIVGLLKRLFSHRLRLPTEKGDPWPAVE
ncbi:MAG: cobalamin B12-binding domain-containing protein [Acidobacteria bacterium]|nr:cobalamin B12-binding domain-containing protein [Acidobacteriota bacterium]